ncbi:RlmE family RNA methyltransferase [Candidatus Gromoviella agglomerans]|uniref:RlmE family RNA methyltransferase n=1 Tax=Candidatus Gromoviella agglomerans TaxID=2806609 RepID=UPI001E56CADC|nr:RlmE family RNA methyltransferase [Candidatus Gromoviella agglomerans]UFX98480.1 Ribosomal RNA large subunit methyltransferase E [Candidatus Gromoviella agglomerans]
MQKVVNKNFKTSSKKWMLRHINDPYVHKAKLMHYRSRAAFKLIQIDDKFKIFSKKNMVIVDLGCSPGGWTQVVRQNSESHKIVGVDLIDMKPIHNVTFINGDFCTQETQERIKSVLNLKANLVLSDIAPPLSGNKQCDVFKIEDIACQVLEFCIKNLKIGGIAIVKQFQFGNNRVVMQYRKYFRSVKLFKPDASRPESSEVYIVADGFFDNDIIGMIDKPH